MNGPDLRDLSLHEVPMVLMYHMVDEVEQDPNDICVTPARFAEQMEWLAKQGLRGVSMSELVDAMRAGTARGLVGLTFDDGYASVLKNVVPELLQQDFTATMFIVSERMGRFNEWDAAPRWPLMSAEEVLQVANARMEIGAHSATHTRLTGVPSEQLAIEVGGSRSALTELLGNPPRGFAYPWGNMDAAARHAVQEAGFGYACSVETPMGDLGFMALPRIVFNQRDGARQMATKKFFLRSYTAARGMRRQMSYNPYAQAVKARVGSH